jgi:L-2-hydroxyglutarate oxidase LhgO
MTERVDCVVVGAGVVGLAIARHLAMAGREVVVVEAEGAIGTQTSSRNTGVIHAGLHYPAGSLKDRLCQRGKALLYAYCAEHGVGHRRLGKLITARIGSGAQGVAELAALKAQAERNGLAGLSLIDATAIRDLEPALAAPAALLSPSSGIVDVHELMLAYLGDIEVRGGWLLRNSPVKGGDVGPDRIDLRIGGPDPVEVRCRVLINSAGHNASAVARSIAGVPPESVPAHLLMKGSYFVLNGRSPFRHLVYPHHHGLHASPDLAGELRFGPDSQWVDKIDYEVEAARAPAFYQAVREFWPDLPDGALRPGWAGVRPKIGTARANDIDFRIDGPELHGIPGLINLFGIESPGLTASLAIGEEVATRLGVSAPAT